MFRFHVTVNMLRPYYQGQEVNAAYETNKEPINSLCGRK
jgi:hypothetical protein